jgi:AraC-like DNA-binding protein
MAYVVADYPLYYDATNEKGLSMAGLNFPGNADYKPCCAGKDNVAPFELIPWILGQCATVAEAEKLLGENGTTIRQAGNGTWFVTQYAVSPEYSAVVIVEPEALLQMRGISLEMIELLYAIRYSAIIALALSLLLFAVGAVYLCCAACRGQGKEGIRPGGLNRLLLDVLCSADACRRLLSSLMEQEGKNLHLFAIRSPILPEILRKLPGFAEKTVFLSSDRVLFLSVSAPGREVLSVVETYQSRALFLYDTSPMKVTALQNVLNQIYKELSDFGQQQTGFLQMSYLGEGVPEHFHTLVFYVDNNYFKDLSLQSLSREFGINYSYLSQVFKKITHKSFSEYLTAVRLGHARQMLSDTQKKVSAIAEQVGYNDYHYFCNIFKKHFDMTPSQYRVQTAKKE